MLKKFSLLITNMIVLFVISCGQQNETFTVEMIKGARHVHNSKPQWGDEPIVALEFVKKIGKTEGEDENYLFYNPYDIIRDTQGNLFICDLGNYRVQKFNQNGEYITTIGSGRKGQGPGEFSMPAQIQIGPDGNLYVCDTNPPRVHVFSNDGLFIKDIRIPINASGFSITQDGNIVLTSELFHIFGDVKMDQSLITVVNSDGDIVKKFGSPIKEQNPLLYQAVNRFAMVLDSDDNIHISFYYHNRIEKYSKEGNLIYRAERPLKYEIIHEMWMRRMEIRGTVRDVPYPSFTFVSDGIGIDNKKRIWIKTYQKQVPDEEEDQNIVVFEIFNRDGVLLSRIPIPKINCMFRMQGNRVYLIDPKDMCIYEYKIVEKYVHF